MKEFDVMSPKLWARALLVLGIVFMVLASFSAAAKDNVQALAILAAGALIAVAIMERP